MLIGRRTDESKVLHFTSGVAEASFGVEGGNSNTHVTTIDERGSPLGLLDEIAEEVRFVGEVEALDASFGDNAAIVRLQEGQNDRSAVPAGD